VSLFALAVLLVVWLAERPALRVRVDLTATRENTLDPATLAVLELLPGEIEVDVFFRPAESPFQRIGLDVQERTRKLLLLVKDAAPGRVRVVDHDVSDRSGRSTEAENRMRELGLSEVEPGGVIVVSLGSRRAALHLRGDLADMDPGDLAGMYGPPQPPLLLSFRAEESLTSALLKVSQGDAPTVVFTTGHDERSLADADLRGLSSLKRALEGDGFKVDTWDGERQGDLAASGGVLAIIGPEKPFSAAETSAIERFIDRGGRMVAAPGLRKLDGPGSLHALLQRWGIRIAMAGMIARPWPQASGAPLEGVPDCARIFVWRDGMRESTITEPLRRADRRVELPYTRGLDRGDVPRGGTLLDLLVSPDDTWRDFADARGGGNFRFDAGEERGPFTLAVQEVFPPAHPADDPKAAAAGLRPECRILCVGSADAFCNALFDANRDFVLNGFNWAASRDFRVNVSHKNQQARRLDIEHGNALAIVNLVAVVIVPGACLLLGLWTAFKRRK
jgi:hypothetical protein